MTYTDKIYGSFKLDSAIEELINTSVLQRLKNIHQGGAVFLVDSSINHTRFDHSMGVMLLIKILGGSLKEQIAGLLHDISHTAFSHLIDYVLDNAQEDYHEKRYEIVLKHKEITSILEKHGFEINDFLDLDQYTLLEYPLPYLCADRIDYTLRDLYQLKQLSTDEIKHFISKLRVHEGRILVQSKAQASWFQTNYNWLLSNYFAGAKNIGASSVLKNIIKDGFKQGFLELNDFHEDDFHVISKIETQLGIQLDQYLKEAVNNNAFTTNIQQKKRFIDPEVLINNQAIPLSALS